MTRSRSAAIVVGILLLLSGCLGGGATTTTGPDDGQSPTVNGTVPPPDALRNDALQAMADVDAYVAVQNATTIAGEGPNRTTTTIAVRYAVNRTTRSVNATRWTTQGGTTVVVDRYVVERTLYQRSEAFVGEYGSEWIRRDVSDGFDRQWHLFDQLWRYRFLLGNASLAPVETTTLHGRDVYVLEATVDTAAMNAALRESLDLPPGAQPAVGPGTNVTATFWIDTDTHRPLQVQRTVTGTERNGSETGPVERAITTHLTYRNVTVSLPDGADAADPVGSG